MVMKPLTDRQRLALAFVEEFRGRQGYPPPGREMVTALGIQPQAAAGQHRLATKHGEVSLPLPRSWVRVDEVFLLGLEGPPGRRG